MFKTLIALSVSLAAASPTFADDILVDASGLQSAHTNVASAMAVARPGDRLLLLPGHYPPFLFEVGVSVIGLGEDAASVVVDRVDLHVSEPSIGYTAVLSNLTAGDGSALNAVPISGNEQSPGVVVIDGVFVDGGVFIGGGADGFHLHMSGSAVEPGPGDGFLGAGVHLGGSAGFSFEIIDSRLAGWDADDDLGVPAGDALHLSGPVRGRLVRTEVLGGDGSSMQPSGGDAVRRFVSGAAVHLRVDGGTLVRGGDAQLGGLAGAALDVGGVLEFGDASVQGGSGAVSGLAFAGDLALESLPGSLHLSVEPAQIAGIGAPAIQSGAQLTLSVDVPADSAALFLALDLGLPAPSPATLISVHSPAMLILNSSASFVVPDIGVDMPGVMLYANAWVRATPGSKLQVSNTVSRRLDLVADIPQG
ncbi:MAG: hypothetical protein DHS20C15_04180 [Planctomycetota bacterium]|nr:MAG: hypothetical protein DHS20C15_04180 [Planctomycetota bacterium]